MQRARQRGFSEPGAWPDRKAALVLLETVTMTHTTFQELFDAVASLLELPSQTLKPDEAGQLGFRIDMAGHGVDVVQCCDGTGRQGVVVAADLGPLPEGDETLLPTSLLNANLMMAATRGPVFGRDACSGHILLYQSHTLADLDGSTLHIMASSLAELARWWRSDVFRTVCADLGQAVRQRGTARSAPADFA